MVLIPNPPNLRTSDPPAGLVPSNGDSMATAMIHSITRPSYPILSADHQVTSFHSCSLFLEKCNRDKW